jgi:transposase-like protein
MESQLFKSGNILHSMALNSSAKQLYFSGESLRKVQKFLKMQGVKVSHVTVYNWTRKYVGLMQKYLESKNFEPELGSTWRADELFVKIKGNPK